MGRPKKVAGAGKPGEVAGVREIVTEISPLWNVLLKRLQGVGRAFGFSRIETSVLEDGKLYQQFFSGSEAELSRLVFLEGIDRAVAVRPAMLPSVLRSYVNNKVSEQYPLSKWLYHGSVARYDAGRSLIADYEFGLEVFGAFNHLTEAQVLSAVWHLLQSVGLEDITLEINSIGNSQCQLAYQDVLKDFLSGRKFELCDDCNEHILGRSLNVFRCPNLECQSVLSEAPTILDFLDEDSHKHFTNILEALDELQIPYQLNSLYIGREGTGRTNVVVKYRHGNRTIIIGEGGYHEELIAALGGKGLCCFGFSGSLSAIQECMELAGVTVEKDQKTEVFLVPLGELAAKKSLRLFRDLIASHISVYDHFGTAGVKNQLKQAEAHRSPIALIMGQKEAMDEMVILRDVKSGMQEIFSYDKIVEEVKKRLGK